MDCIHLPYWTDSRPFFDPERRLPRGSGIRLEEAEWIMKAGIRNLFCSIPDAILAGPGMSDPVLLVHSAGVRRFSPEAMRAEMLERGAEVLVLGHPGDRPGPRMITAPDGRLEEPGSAMTTNLMDAGVWLAGRDVLLETLDRAASPSDLLAALLGRGVRIHVELQAAYVSIPASAADFLLLCADILSGSVPDFPGSCSTLPGILVENGARISPGAGLHGLCWIATGASVGDGCRIENCVILEDASIGTGVSLRNAMVLPGSVVREGTDLSDKYIKVIGG